MDERDEEIKKMWKKVTRTGSVQRGEKCPGSEILSQYIDDVLNINEKERIEHHLTECEYCLDTVLLHHKLKEPELSPDAPGVWIERAKNLFTVQENEAGNSLYDIILKCVKETIEVIKNPGNLTISYETIPVPVRSDKEILSANLITLGKTFDDVESEVEVEKIGESYVNMKIMIKDIRYGNPVEGLRISLFNPHREIASYVARNGEACFEGLRLGEYVIKITKVSKKIGQISLNIK